MAKQRTRAQAHTPNTDAAAVWAPIDSIHPWENNPRNNDDAVASVARSIEEFGFASPIVARKSNNEIIAGHTRYWAARQLNLKEVPVRFLDITAEQARTLALADNKLGEIATWDNDKLRELLAECDHDSAHIAGWNDGELAALLDEHAPQPQPRTQPSNNGPADTPPETQPTQNTEIDVADMQFDHECPKCGFEF